MANFVNENNEVVQRVLDEEMDNAAGADKAQAAEAHKEFEERKDGLLRKMSVMKKNVTILIDKNQKKEEEYNQKIQEEIEQLQEVAFEKQLAKNDQMKNQILQSF